MQKIIFLLLLTYLLACNSQTNNTSEVIQNKNSSSSSTGYTWTELTKNAAFPRSYNFQMLTIRDTLWVLHHNNAWFSLDGVNWTKSKLLNIIKNNAFLDYVWFNNALYGLGTFEGNIVHYTLKSAIHRTTDMKNWDLVVETSTLPKRFFYHPFVFDNKIWIIGGGTENESFSDVWNSSDGVKWTKQADSLPFGKRQDSQFIFFKNRLFMLNNDVWSSTDAIHWIKEADRIVPENIFGYSAIVYDNKIWLLGCNRNKIFKSDVITSEDAKIWTVEKAPWSPRGGATSCIYKNKIFMTGGKYGGTAGEQTNFVYSNEVWTLEKK